MTVVLPGDVIPLASSSSIKLGPGLLPTPSSSTPSLTAIRSGALGSISSSSSKRAPRSAGSSETALWVETNTARYTPSPGDSVIAQITNRGAESYTLSLLTSAHPATLPALSFEGATKRHKPNLRIGSLVYARVVSADRFTEPELTCVNPITGKSDGFGDLKTTDERGERNGVAMLFSVSVGLARSLGRPGNGLFKMVAECGIAFEAATGANGKVWVRGSEVKHVIAVGRVLAAADQTAITVTSSNQEMEEADEAGIDADEVLKSRGKRLDAKTVRRLVQDLL